MKREGRITQEFLICVCWAGGWGGGGHYCITFMLVLLNFPLSEFCYICHWNCHQPSELCADVCVPPVEGFSRKCLLSLFA